MTTAQRERAELALLVIGPDRRERLITRYADGLCLRHGMRADEARRYAANLVDEVEPAAVLAVGQTWSQRDGKTIKGAEIFESVRATSYTVEGFSGDGMVLVNGGGLHLNARLFKDMWLSAWPDTYTLTEAPQPPQDPIPEADEADDEPADDGDRFNPHSLWILAHRVSKDDVPRGEGLPLVGTYYRAVNWHKPEYEPSYGNALDVPAYLAEHLADYRAGWPDFRDQFKSRDWLNYFNELGRCEVNIAVAAYLGHWLWQRVRADVVREYGGTVDDYDVMHMWSPAMADVVIEAAPYAHPEWDIPSDHPLAQCEGQTSLLDALSPAGGHS